MPGHSIVEAIKLETGLRPNSAGIPYTLLSGIEAIGFPTFGLLLYIINEGIMHKISLGSRPIAFLQLCLSRAQRCETSVAVEEVVVLVGVVVVRSLVVVVVAVAVAVAVAVGVVLVVKRRREEEPPVAVVAVGEQDCDVKAPDSEFGV